MRNTEITAVAQGAQALQRRLLTRGADACTACKSTADEYDWALLGSVASLERLGLQPMTAAALAADRLGLDVDVIRDWYFERELARAGMAVTA